MSFIISPYPYFISFSPHLNLITQPSGQLHTALIEEMKRRGILQTFAAKEAGIIQPALSKFIAKAVIPNNDRGQTLSVTLLRYPAPAPACPLI